MGYISDLLFGPATCVDAGNCVCENFIPVLGIAQPINIVTSMLIVLMGVFVFNRLKGLYYKTAMGYAFGLMFVGIAAMYLHYRMDYLGQVLDFTAVTISIILLELIARFKKDSYFVVFGLFVVVLLLNILLPDYRTIIAIVAISYFLFMNVVVRKNWDKIKMLVFSFLFGATLWYLDDKHWMCNPTSIIQLHAIWHLIVAILSYYNAVYYFKYVFPKAFN